MARSSAIVLPQKDATSESIMRAAYDGIKEQFNSPKGWMGVRTINLVDENEKVVETYLVKFRKDRAEIFKATGEFLPLTTTVKVGKVQKV